MKAYFKCVILCFTYFLAFKNGFAQSEKMYLQAGFGVHVPHDKSGNLSYGRQFQNSDYIMVALGRKFRNGRSLSLEVAHSDVLYVYNDSDLFNFYTGNKNRINQYSLQVVWNNTLLKVRKVSLGTGIGIHYEKNYLSEGKYDIAGTQIRPGILDYSYTDAGLLARITSGVKLRNAEIQFQAEMYWLYTYKSPGFIFSSTLKVPF